MASAIPATLGFYDECLKGEVQFPLGFMKSSPLFSFGRPGSFGAPGAGGSLGFADSAAGLGYAYVPNRKGTGFTGDPRERALRDVLYSALSRSEKADAPPEANRELATSLTFD
jgi:CubicO group peptidase (beta-lactamase class C family)